MLTRTQLLKPIVDISGLRCGMLVAVRCLGSNGKHAIWELQCDCGNTKEMLGKEFKRGKIKSCGCSSGRLTGEATRTHGDSKKALYAIWRSMLDRCFRPSHPAYKNYGGRGITVCDRWVESYENFREDVIGIYQEGLDIDRIDNNGNYEPRNVRWTTRTVNARNRRKTILIDSPLGRMTIAELSGWIGIGVSTLFYRYQNGWSPEEMMLPPGSKRCTT